MLVFSVSANGQSLIQNLYFSSGDDITRLNFSTSPPNVSYTGIPMALR